MPILECDTQSDFSMQSEGTGSETVIEISRSYIDYYYV